MKKVIKIINVDDDSEEAIEVKQDKEIKIYLSQDKPQIKSKKIALWKPDQKQRQFLNARMIQFSDFLRDLQTGEDSQENIIMEVIIPPIVFINRDLINLIQLFYRRHRYSLQKIRINKITIEGYKKTLDQISLYYFQNELSIQTEQTLKNMFNLCQYLKLNHLKQLVTTCIASKHFFFFNQKIMQQKIEEQQAYYSRQEQIRISLKLKNYAKQLSIDLLEQVKNRYDKKYNKSQYN